MRDICIPALTCNPCFGITSGSSVWSHAFAVRTVVIGAGFIGSHAQFWKAISAYTEFIRWRCPVHMLIPQIWKAEALDKTSIFDFSFFQFRVGQISELLVFCVKIKVKHLIHFLHSKFPVQLTCMTGRTRKEELRFQCAAGLRIQRLVKVNRGIPRIKTSSL